MELFSKITGYVRELFSNVPLSAVLIVFGFLLLTAMVVYFFLKKVRRPEKGKQPGELGAKDEEKKKRIPPSSLVQVWDSFLRKIPWMLRPNIMAYQHFIVFGETGSGKSTLIGNYTDWQGHARQFYPSHTTNPLLQIYLGSKVLVQEVSANLLNDTSEHARRALLNLWKRLFRRKEPIVVIVLNEVDLQTEESEYSEYLKHRAQIIRGKINLLCQICKKPVEVRIALTSMDHIEGFPEFSHFLDKSNLPLKFDLGSQGGSKDIVGCLDHHEEHLTRALNIFSADKYLKVMAFFRQAPRFLRALSVFVKFLESPDPLSQPPVITDCFLTSQTQGAVPGLNPFASSITAWEIQKYDPHFKHRVAAVVIGIAGIAFLASAFLHERSLVFRRFSEVATVDAFPPAGYDQKMHDILPFVYNQQHPWMHFLPDFYPEVNREITRHCMENIRRLYLTPALERISAAMTTGAEAPVDQVVTIDNSVRRYSGTIEDAQDKALYLLALFYSTRDNELGNLVRNNIPSWSQILGVSSTLIADYLNNNEISPRISAKEKKISSLLIRNTVVDPQHWVVFFNEVAALYRQQVLTGYEFEKVQRESEHFLAMLQKMELYDLSVKISDLLKKVVPPDIDLEMIARKKSEFKQESLKGFLQFLRNSKMNYPEVTDNFRFADLLDNIKVMADINQPQNDNGLTFQFVLGGEQFKFNAKQWNDVVSRSRITLLLRLFLEHYSHQDGLLFFPADKKEFNDIIMNASNDGRFLFLGHARIDGRFTREAIDKRVGPILTELPAIIENLPVSSKDKSDFAGLLLREVDLYGRRYAEYYRNYYMDFDIKAGSPGALRFVVSQMTMPSSPLREVLQTVRDNTQIDFGKNQYLQSLALSLTEFDFIKRLLGDQKGAFPELDKYKALLEQMQVDMQDQQGFIGEKKTDETFNAFKKRLSPLGRISFAIFNEDKDSYLNLVKLWIESVGVPPKWQDIFYAPVWQAYYLGITEVEKDIDTTWSDLMQRDIQSISDKFPFLMTSSADTPMDAIFNATHPSGHFWKTYQAMLAPFCTHEGYHWQEKARSFPVPRLPANMLPVLNAVGRLSSVLWDKEGKGRPLEIMVRPEPLPSILPEEPIALDSYLQAGDSGIFGFNQKPSWRRVQVDWQIPSWAAVGVEFKGPDGSGKFKKSITIPASNWSFFRLLRKAKGTIVSDRADDLSSVVGSGGTFSTSVARNTNDAVWTATWQVDTAMTKGEGKAMDIAFSFRDNPWSIFMLPR
jgi:hypothetical protein